MKYVGSVQYDDWPFPDMVMRCTKCGSVVDSSETDEYDFDYLSNLRSRNVDVKAR